MGIVHCRTASFGKPKFIPITLSHDACKLHQVIIVTECKSIDPLYTSHEFPKQYTHHGQCACVFHYVMPRSNSSNVGGNEILFDLPVLDCIQY